MIDLSIDNGSDPLAEPAETGGFAQAVPHFLERQPAKPGATAAPSLATYLNINIKLSRPPFSPSGMILSDIGENTLPTMKRQDRAQHGNIAMKRFHREERGVAAIEAVLGMLILVPLLLVLVEASRALLEYSQLQNAAMEGARMVSRQNGDPSGVADYMKSLFQNSDASSTLAGQAPTVTVGSRDSSNNVTVQVDHVFSPFFASQSDSQGGSGLFSLVGTDALTLSAKVVTALPAPN
ncbi:TadE/TadG family type IV pilus assembly protein [Desulfovibrio sp. TomC]|uniref:TadE/TadG family type IV pilus assembly protein n=1 Tax=Desulfovibrio sp. TomC TaxID=1562888 RepID=UPI00057330FC|nr:TadE/TadG family type IV pilus assembly protein [Desulfovibrio sp. TomC]KHK02253.1 hypothetical protein NY78_2384 [Desulfovibrio sp. TomC]